GAETPVFGKHLREALLRTLDTLISDATELPVVVAEDPLTSVVRGVGQMLEDMHLLKRIALA
ncbi:MAG: rod shape-determining protein, partial [Nitrospirota bacterium]